MSEIIHQGSYLTLHYQIVLNSGPGKGNVFIDTFAHRPATLLIGSGQWLPALEAPLLGKTVGDEFSYEVPAAQAYGLRNPDLLQYVSRDMLMRNAGEEATFNPDDLVEFTAPDGSKYSGLFRGFEGDKALFDFNHPLAGIDLKVTVRIVGVM